MIIVAIVPAIIYTYKAFSQTSYLTVNNDGIFERNVLVTNWNNFVSAEINEEEIVGSYRDNFVLIINYYKENTGYYVRKIRLTNTQDKSEEEIIAAINHFRSVSGSATQ